MFILKKYSWIVLLFMGVTALVKNLGQKKPTKTDFNEFVQLGEWLLFGGNDIAYNLANEYEGYDGFFNNPSKPDLGAIDTHLLRRIPAAYDDGSYQPSGKNRPNPLTLSEELLNGTLGTKSNTGKNALLVFFGQQIVEEILDAQRPACPPEYFNIPIPPNHRYRNVGNFSHTEMPVLRTRYDQRSGYSPNNPRQQLNEITPYIDGGLIYGTSKTWVDALRLYANGTLAENGTLATSDDRLFPERNKIRLPMANPPPPVDHYKFVREHELLNVNRFHKLGNPRGNENPFLLTFGVVWFRWHNYIANSINRRKPNWSNERIFNEARKWVIASQQQIIFYEWLPEWLHASVPNYTGYDSSVDPQIDQLFQAAAFRFGHTLVTPAIKLRDYARNNCKNVNHLIRTCNHYWKSPESIEYYYSPVGDNNTKIIDIDRLILGMAYQTSEREDSEIVEDLRGNVFGPLEFSRRDLMALNIQRARDHGLPDYNSARKAFGLKPLKTFQDFEKFDGNVHPQKFKKKILDLKRLYKNDINNIDIWIGGILETSLYGPGELFTTIIKDQFERIRKGDRFWFEYQENGLFSIEEIKRLKQLTFYDILMAVTKFEHDDLPKRVFSLPFESVFCVISFLLLTKKSKPRKESECFRQLSMMQPKYQPFSALLWEDLKKPYRHVVVVFDEKMNQIQILSSHSVLLRTIYLNNSRGLEIYCFFEKLHIGIKLKNEYDLVLKISHILIKEFYTKLITFLKEMNVPNNTAKSDMSLKTYLKSAMTKAQRKQDLEKYFKATFSTKFNPNNRKVEAMSDVAHKTELTFNEFADALSIGIHSDFAKKMFDFVDKDKNGYISARELVQYTINYSEGTEKEKLKCLFSAYANNMDLISKEDFINMIRSSPVAVNTKVDASQLELTIQNMLRKIVMENKDQFDFEEFLAFIQGHYLDLARQAGRALSYKSSENDNHIGGKAAWVDEQAIKYKIIQMLSIKAAEVFWYIFFTCILFLIFAERFYVYNFEREHSGLRRILGYGVAMTRGAASSILFCHAVMLLTMCRYSITVLRETRLYYYFPFDSSVDLHKYVACWSLFFTIIHVVGHGFNFYHISTQTADDITCLFRNVYHSTHEIPKLNYWIWETITGITGICLVLLTIVMYSFTIPKIRMKLYKAFWFTHHLYPLFYITLYLHGIGRLIQAPIFLFYLLVPGVIYIIDSGYGLSRKKVKISVKEAKFLSSDVMMLRFAKPNGFSYKSGQWVRIACPEYDASEYHPLSLSSSPHEADLTVHIRAVGPWTRTIRTMFESTPYPEIYLDGPFGGGHQNWDQFNVAILIAGGIGVTPFASILKNQVHSIYTGTCHHKFKIYFLWVTRTQKQFEWMVDTLRDIEAKDVHGFIQVHIFINQIPEKFELPSILLYLCERVCQQSSNRSLITGLRACTHFGQPKFTDIFTNIQKDNCCSQIGVFTCGKPSLIKTVEESCMTLNIKRKITGTVFEHHFKTY